MPSIPEIALHENLSSHRSRMPHTTQRCGPDAERSVLIGAGPKSTRENPFLQGMAGKPPENGGASSVWRQHRIWLSVRHSDRSPCTGRAAGEPHPLSCSGNGGGHAARGQPLDALFKLHALSKGYSGIRTETAEALLHLFNSGRHLWSMNLVRSGRPAISRRWLIWFFR